MGWLLLIVLIVVAVFVLKGFDVIAGRGSRQVSDGIKRSSKEHSIDTMRECPHCAELILATDRVCKHCGRDVEPIV